jgi:adenylosuccinate synthase
MPNAGHTFIDGFGKSFIFKMLPVGSLYTEHTIIGPHAVIDVDRLMVEIAMIREAGSTTILHIHPLANVLNPEDRAWEKNTLNHIASTMQGSAGAQIRKMSRDPGCMLAKDDPRLAEYIKDTHELMRGLINNHYTTLIETAQGFDLGINNGFYYPFTTSRDCMLGRVLDNAGVHPRELGNVIGSIRTYPIRVGNTEGGFSGPCYDDQHEITWKELSEKLGRDVLEFTTVTKRVRRVFTFSYKQMERFVEMIQPDYMFLNFTNYLTDGERDEFIGNLTEFLDDRYCRLALLGTGAGIDDMVVL